MRRTAAALAFCWALAAHAAAAFDPAGVLPGESALAPLRRGAAIERHTPDTLWERIDGEAELYRAYGLTSSAHAIYADPADDGRRVDLSAFLFSDPLGAFGVFAAFRSPECSPVARIGNGGCLADYQGFFWQGALFVLADAAGPEESRPADIRRALDSAAALAGAAPARPDELRAFSRVAETRSIRYQPRHLLGREALPPGLEGSASGVAVFVSVGPCNAQAAGAALDGYATALTGAVRGEREGHQVLTGHDPALGQVALVGN